MNVAKCSLIWLKAFTGRSLFLRIVVFNAIAALFGFLFPVAFSIHVITVGTILTTLFGAIEIFATWRKETTYRQLLALPISRFTLATSLLLVVAFIGVIEIACPIVLFLGMSGHLDVLLVFYLLALSLEISFITIGLFGSLLQRISSSLAIVLALIASILSFTHWYVLIILIPFACASFFLSNMPRYGVRLRAGFRMPGVFLREIYSNRTFLINYLALTIFAAIFAYTSASAGIDLPIFLAILGISSPYVTILSRNQDSIKILKLLPRTGLFYTNYTFQFILLYILSAVPSLAVYLTIRSGTYISLLITTGSIAVLCAVTMCILEKYFPIKNAKTERDILKHPRKYFPALLAFLAISVFSMLMPY